MVSDFLQEALEMKLKYRYLAIIIAAFILIFYFVFINAVPDYRSDQKEDAFEYIGQAKDILHGHGFLTKHWMPGFPYFLSMVIKITGVSWEPLKIVMILISFSALFAAYLLFSRIVEIKTAVMLSLYLAVIPLYFDYSHRVMSEIPYLLASLLAVYFICQLNNNYGKWKYLILATIGSFAAIMIRGNGLALVAALFSNLLQFRKPNSKQLSIAILLIVMFSAWTIRNSHYKFSGIDNITYLQEVQASNIKDLWSAGGFSANVSKIDLKSLSVRVYQNFAWYISTNFAKVLNPFISNKHVPLVLIFCIPGIIGIIRLFKISPPSFAYCISSIFLLLIYPTGGAQRMFIAVIPFILVSTYLGIEAIFKKKNLAFLIMALFGVLNSGSCFSYAMKQKGSPYNDTSFVAFSETLTKIPKNYPVFSSNPWAVRAMTNAPVMFATRPPASANYLYKGDFFDTAVVIETKEELDTFYKNFQNQYNITKLFENYPYITTVFTLKRPPSY